MKKVTINDIAERIGVTPSTISRALANNKRVSVKTRELVKKVAQEMGYQPNLMASSLRRGTSDLIGMIVPRINRHFFSNVISGVEEILKPEGYSLLIMQSQENIETEQKAVQSLLRNRVGGVIVSMSVETDNFNHFKSIKDAGIPLVQFDRVADELSGTKVINDNYKGAYQATKSLLQAGYKKVAHFGGSELLDAYIERRRGFEDAVREHRGEVNQELIKMNIITREAGYSNINDLLKLGVDAVFCAGDYAAFGVSEALQECNIKVPESFGIASFGNEPFAEMMHPKLSSVEQQGREMGKIIAKQMIQAIYDEEQNIQLVVPVNFIERASSKR